MGIIIIIIKNSKVGELNTRGGIFFLQKSPFISETTGDKPIVTMEQ